MKHLRDELDSLAQDIIREKEVATKEAIEAAEEARAGAEPALTEVTLPDGYQRHLITYLQAEKTRYQKGKIDEPLCDCSNPYCPLKRGQLPARVRMAEDPEDGIREYRDQHDGDARVLQSARDDWIEKCSEVKQHLDHALALLRGAAAEAAEAASESTAD